MYKQICWATLGIGVVIAGCKVISDFAEKNAETKELKEKIREEYIRRKDFDLEILTDIINCVTDLTAPYKNHPIPFDDAL